MIHHNQIAKKSVIKNTQMTAETHYKSTQKRKNTLYPKEQRENKCSLLINNAREKTISNLLYVYKERKKPVNLEFLV